jgi:hypothetical protein
MYERNMEVCAMMDTTTETLLDEITSFLVKQPTAEEIIAFRPSAVLQQRARELLEFNQKNELSAQQREEMHEFMRIEHFMTVLKAKARLNQS